MMNRSIIAVALAATFAAPLHAQAAHPSLAGTWVLDPSKTVNGIGAPLPESLTRTIAQHGDTLLIDTDVTSEAGPQHTHMVYAVDGKAWHNMASVGGQMTDVSSTLAWQGSTLVITTSISAMGTDVTQVDRWTMAADGKSATSTRAITQDGTDLGTVTLIFNKKP